MQVYDELGTVRGGFVEPRLQDLLLVCSSGTQWSRRRKQRWRHLSGQRRSSLCYACMTWYSAETDATHRSTLQSS